MLVLSACGSGTGHYEGRIWPDIDLDQYESIPRLEDLAWGTVTPSEETTYWELRQNWRGVIDSTITVIGSDGEKCAEADDPDACRADARNISLSTALHMCALMFFVAAPTGPRTGLLSS